MYLKQTYIKVKPRVMEGLLPSPHILH